jgi:hypothetical protein
MSCITHKSAFLKVYVYEFDDVLDSHKYSAFSAGVSL